MGRTIHYLNLGKDFVHRTPFFWELRPTVDNWDLIKQIRFCTSKETTSQVKKKLAEWKSMFVAIYLIEN